MTDRVWGGAGFAAALLCALAPAASRGAELASPQGALAAPFTAPQRIATADTGDLYVVDGRGGQLSTLTPRGDPEG